MQVFQPEWQSKQTPEELDDIISQFDLSDKRDKWNDEPSSDSSLDSDKLIIRSNHYVQKYRGKDVRKGGKGEKRGREARF